MSTRSAGKTATQNGVPLPVLIGTSLAVLLFVVWLGFHFLNGADGHVAARPLSSDELWIKQKAIESGGDITKLSVPDQQRLFSLKGDSAPAQLKYFAGKK